MSKAITKGQIRRLGNSIRENTNTVSTDNLELLQAYRTSYKDALSKAFTLLTTLTRSVYTEAILSYRIKRIDSIIRKLHRKPKMQLDRMGDIVGCRCILKNEKQIRKLERKIKENFWVNESQTRDYYKNENPTGYRSLHLYIKLEEDHSEIIEVQLRTQVDHNWATLVEITDLLLDDTAKESDDYTQTKFGKFHKILSHGDDRTEKETRYILDIVIKYDLYNLISKTFINNYVEVRTQWVSNEKSKFKNFFVIVSQKDTHPIINSFTTYEEAENEYFIQFKSDNKANLLLTHLQNNCYEKISIAYSNYILTTHVFIYDFLTIIENAITNTIRNKNFNLYVIYLSVYFEILKNIMNELSSEIKEVNQIETTKENKNRKKDWTEDLDKRIRKIKIKSDSFTNKFNFEINNLSIIYRKIFKHLTNQTIEKLKNKAQKNHMSN